MQILQILSSPRGAASYSNQLANGLVEKLVAAHPGSQVTVRDLANQPFPHLDTVGELVSSGESYLQRYLNRFC